MAVANLGGTDPYRLDPFHEAPEYLQEYRALAAGGHGWVLPRPDGSKAKCGGPQVCFQCRLEQMLMQAQKRTVVMQGFNLKPGDKVLLIAPHNMDGEQYQRIMGGLRRDFPEVFFSIAAGFAGVQVHSDEGSPKNHPRVNPLAG